MQLSLSAFSSQSQRYLYHQQPRRPRTTTYTTPRRKFAQVDGSLRAGHSKSSFLRVTSSSCLRSGASSGRNQSFPLVEEVTGIECAVLTHAKQLGAVSVAARMIVGLDAFYDSHGRRSLLPTWHL